MRPHLTRATAARIVHQTLNDRRTLVLIAVAPLVLLTLIHYLFDGQEPLVSRLELQLLVVFPVFIMFLLTAIATVRERTSGTMERLFTTPIGKVDIVAGYTLAYGLLALVQATLASAFCWWVLDMQIPAPFSLVPVTVAVGAVLGVMFGLLASAISHTEFQAIQFMPAVLLPQMLLCGLLVPRDQMAGWMEAISNFLPLSYTMDAVNQQVVSDHATQEWWVGIGITVGCILILLGLASSTLRRRTQ